MAIFPRPSRDLITDMIVNSLEQLGPDNPLRTVIVGGGTVGIYLAVLLSRQGCDVVVIEAGDQNLGNFEASTYECTGLPHEGIRIGRSRGLGGTSNLWGGQLVEYQRADFVGREWLPDSRWPVGYDEIAAWHRPTYENLGIPARLTDDREVFRELNNPAPELGEGVEVFLTRWLKIPSFASVFETEMQTLGNLRVLLNHVVSGFEGSGGSISAVSIVKPDGSTSRLAGARFILASGTIEIVRLLLHSAESPGWDCPWRGNGNLGAYFQDHVGGRAASVHPLDRKRFLDVFSTIVLGGQKFQPKLRFTSATLETEPTLNMQGMMYFESSISENMVFLKQFLKAAIYSRRISGVMPLVRNLIGCGRHLPPLMWRYIVQNRVFVPSGSKISFMLQSEQTPLLGSRISIDRSQLDVFGLPKVLLDWRIGDFELRAMHDFTVRCNHALEASGLAKMRIVDDLERLSPDYLRSVLDNYHHAGGARMGETAADGVVDKDLLVFGTDNLYVLGAAVFRTTSNANTTFLALTFATRLAARLASRAER